MFAFIIALLWTVFTGQGHIVTYDNPGQSGIIVQTDTTHCVGYEYQGNPGFFGNEFGLTGGECS